MISRGMKIGRWTVLEPALRNGSKRMWKCLCACGSIRTIEDYNLKNGHTKSCGCGRKDNKPNLTHGQSKTYLYRIWSAMRNRCYRSSVKGYQDYGGRGISVCPKWRNSFECFRADVGDRPTSAHTLGRIDNKGNYTPENVRWETRSQQGRNKRNNRTVLYRGKLRTISELSESYGVNYGTLWDRLFRYNKSIEEALTVKDFRL